jgi:type IV secretory pathway TrbL component
MQAIRFANLSYKWKIRYVISIAVTLAVILMGFLFGIYDYRVQKQDLISENSAIAGLSHGVPLRLLPFLTAKPRQKT